MPENNEYPSVPLAGNMVSHMLADYGADVIKDERHGAAVANAIAFPENG